MKPFAYLEMFVGFGCLLVCCTCCFFDTLESDSPKPLSSIEAGNAKGAGGFLVCGAYQRPCGKCVAPVCTPPILGVCVWWNSGTAGYSGNMHGTCAQYTGCNGCTCGYPLKPMCYSSPGPFGCTPWCNPLTTLAGICDC
jgi:hypothetical protein